MLTIIIPYYKISFFKETLQSLERQTCKNFKLFIGNDASPENPENLIKETLKTTAFNYKEYTENFGFQNLVKQWERCIQDSEISEWFQILGDDDVLLPDFVENFYKNLAAIEGYGCKVIKVKRRTIDGNGNFLSDFTNYDTLIDVKQYFSNKILNGARSSLSEHIFKISSYKKFGFRDFPLAWASDDAAILEFSECRPIYFINKGGVLIRISNENISGKKDNLDLKEKAGIIYQKFLLNKHLNKIDKKAALHLINMQIFYRYHHNIPLSINLPYLYLRLGCIKKIITLPRTFYILQQHKKK